MFGKLRQSARRLTAVVRVAASHPMYSAASCITLVAGIVAGRPAGTVYSDSVMSFLPWVEEFSRSLGQKAMVDRKVLAAFNGKNLKGLISALRTGYPEWAANLSEEMIENTNSGEVLYEYQPDMEEDEYW